MPLRNTSRMLRNVAVKTFFRLASFIVVAYLIIAIVSLGSLRIDDMAWYGVVLVAFGVITYLLGWACWFAGPVLLVVAGIEYRHDVKRARAHAQQTAQ